MQPNPRFQLNGIARFQAADRRKDGKTVGLGASLLYV